MTVSPEIAVHIIASSTGSDVRELAIATETLRGGLVSERVERITARYRDRKGTPRLTRFVVKHLSGVARREAKVYARVSRAVGEYAPRVLHVEEHSKQTLLYLEWVNSPVRWPWRDYGKIRQSTAHLSQLHRRLGPLSDIPSWDYGTELEAAAANTVKVLETLPADEDLRRVRRVLPAATRLASNVRAAQTQLLTATPLPLGLIHGDVHPSNVVLREQKEDVRPVLLDWARARYGSPLEDLSAWLQSLSHWEPAAARHHDHLLTTYMHARGETAPTRALRDGYWLAAGINALAGALSWNMSAYCQATTPKSRREALIGANGWARCVRQADQRWRA